jgi:hypothetical protein
MINETKRKAKIQNFLRKRKWQTEVLVPKITLAGLWLEENGFLLGDELNVVVSKGKITITKQNKDDFNGEKRSI